MVNIQSSYTVTPSEPTPEVRLFSLCEQIKLRTHAPSFYAYNPTNFDKINIHNLRDALSKALSIYYPFAGRLCWTQGGRWEIHCNAKGALLIEASCKGKTLEDLRDFVPNGLVTQLIPNIDYSAPLEDTPILAVQLTRFSCGGVTVGVAMCRGALDGTGGMRFINTWAKLARGEPLDESDQYPCHDRTELNSRKMSTGSEFSDKNGHDHSEYGTPPPWLGSLGTEDAKVAVEVMKLTGEQVKKLKMKATSTNGNGEMTKPFSSFEAIAGHLWKSVSKARYEGNSAQPTRLTTLVNCRNRLKPPLPPVYAGNAAFPTTTPTCTFGDLIENPVGFAATKVKGAIAKVDDEFVRSALEYIDNVKDMNLIRYNFHYPAKSVHKGPSKGNPNLFVVSWMNFSYEHADFGWGVPYYFGPVYMDAEGKAFCLNKPNGDGMVHVAISLDSAHMPAFKKIFYEDI
ncbi:hydroxycinnamoyl-CoA:piscidic acid hydroxycinnamoyltransferase-like [Arachis stenosperma]|uniref:hydroxycinnamoyl-CoA:piscidic acid hydroxycinnamoyltransferase-like n=1 Tax=Arachis stenosperma TaxID=217475 RepID=UPI0025ACBA24|nr:hydroxycinnamoyl-CoA:piscidic acid hydroxycinnamoyltransferase-like [Arachis stenosperma]